MLRGSRAFSGKIRRQFLAQVAPPFTTKGLWWRHLAVQVGTTKDHGLYNMPWATVHPGALAAGILLQYNTDNIASLPIQRNKDTWQRRCPAARQYGS